MAQLASDGRIDSVFVYGPKPNVPTYMVKEGTRYRIVSNHLGSVRRVVNTQTGQVVQRMKYDAFGRVILNTNPGFQPFGFGGGLYDQQTGLVRFGARDYDPTVGRWTAKDPLLFGGGSSNLYGYALNDPVNEQDLFGLAVEICKRPLDIPAGEALYEADPFIPGNEYVNWEFAHHEIVVTEGEPGSKVIDHRGFTKEDGGKVKGDKLFDQETYQHDYECRTVDASEQKAQQVLNRLDEKYKGNYFLPANNCQDLSGEFDRRATQKENGSPEGANLKPDSPHPRTHIPSPR